MINKWNFSEISDEENQFKNDLAHELSINPILAKLLVQRGIKTFDEARTFFRPNLNDLHNPFLMKDMDLAVKRLTKAMQNNEKILIYGDYDVDGTTSVSLVYRFLIELYSNLDFYIPDRYTEGYGISMKGIEFAHENNFTLVIALDCGIKAVEKVKYAKTLGVDFIICDHHNPDAVIPPAEAVLDPKRLDCEYPFKELSGCGVGFKFMQAFAIENDIHFKELIPLLDLVALSIASDIVPIMGENRILAYYGLKQLNTEPSTGVKAILEVCELTNKEISISDIVFKIGPRINASGRMKHAKEAVKLLISKDYSDAIQLSTQINTQNEARKDLDKNITNQASLFIKENKEFETRKSIVVFDPKWHKGVIGIVASRLTEEYYKPTVVLTESNGFASGSARSVPGFDLYKAIESCKHLLENFGGHMYAAGLTMKVENVEAFSKLFEEAVASNIEEQYTYPQIDIDAIIEFRDITPKFFRILKQFAPFGPGNMKPYFVSKNVYDFGNSKLVGRGQEHLKLELTDNSSENVMSGIAFNMHRFNDHLKALNPLDICYTIEENNYNNQKSIQLMIRDIKKVEKE